MKLLALLTRLGFAAIACAVLALVGLQYARAVARNVALAHALDRTRDDVSRLETRRAEQLRTIRRLRDPHGAIPEIHDRLHQVAPGEAIIYLRGVATPGPLP
ncbi:MAG: hypothetical protein ABI346_05025 [Candidatus Baltobacteraceae bacterium]